MCGEMKIRRAVEAMPEVVHQSKVTQFGERLSEVSVGTGLPTVDEMNEELLYMCNVLLGKEESPVQSPYLGLCEVATAFYGRGCELDMLIHMAEQEEQIPRGHPLQKLRTGQLRTFNEMARKMADLGSRRLTQERLLYDQRYDSGDVS